MTSRILRQKKVSERKGLPRASLYVLDDFPKPIQLGGRRVGWIEAEIDEWIELRKKQRDAA